MLTNIDNLYVVAALSFVFVFGYMALKQWSEFEDHKKKHSADDPETKAYKDASKFAFVPYFIIPAIFACLSTVAALFIVDYAAYNAYVSGSEGVAVCAIISAVAVYIVMDFGLVSHVGDAAYFRFIESKVFQTVVSLDWEDLTADEQKAVMEGKSIKQIMKERKLI